MEGEEEPKKDRRTSTNNFGTKTSKLVRTDEVSCLRIDSLQSFSRIHDAALSDRWLRGPSKASRKMINWPLRKDTMITLEHVE